MINAAKDAAKRLKSTLRLPSTSFPPRPVPADLERYLPRCTDDLYSWQRRQRPVSNTFILHDGPPYANGDLHVGHALNKILKDIVCRSELAKGKRIDYVPGWDCHGLPIELKALEKHGWKRGENVDAVSIRHAAKGFALDAIKKQMAGFRSWAVMGDWENHWETMHKAFEVHQLEVFRMMADHGMIYRKHKPVYWSPSSGTALAEAELEYQDDHVSTAAYVKYPLRGACFSSDPVYALIWTTTPWTLPANQAIAINPSMEYALVYSSQHGFLVVASSRIQAMRDILGQDLTIQKQSISARELLNCSYDGPRQFGSEAADRPLIAAEFVSADSGTGLVHCAPGHGMEDYQALQQMMNSGRVAVKAPVDMSGRFDATASPAEPHMLEGQDVFTAGNETILRWLEQAGLLVHRHKHAHKYPIDWRTKEPVIIRATAQWFADLTSIRGDALQAIEQTTFVPVAGKNRLRSFVENRTEWCISRQRAWGVPIPALYRLDDGEAVLSPESVSHIIDVIRQRGTDAWWADDPHDAAWLVKGLNPALYRRGTDTMDVWFDSGSSWTALLPDNTRQEGTLADMYLEGTDQHRGWFQSSLLTNAAYQKTIGPASQVHAPFKKLVTHGFTLDADGKKMSKSLGNVISPDQVVTGITQTTKFEITKSSKQRRELHSLGPDALRLWVASSDWTKDVTVSDTVIKTVHAALDKYRVTFKLLLGLLKWFDPSTIVPYGELSQLDQIALLHLYETMSTVQTAFSELEFHRASTAINRWVVNDLSGFYFEAIKDVCYCDPQSSQRHISACTALHHIFSHLQNMLGPLCPLLVEESWEHSTNFYKVTIEHPLKRTWEAAPDEWRNDAVQDLLPIIMAVNSNVKAGQESARSEKLLGQSLASDVKLYALPGSRIGEVAIETWKEALVVSDVEVVECNSIGLAAASETWINARSWVRQRKIMDADNRILGVALTMSPTMEKCGRCWKYTANPEQGAEIALCKRCIATVEDLGG